MSNILVLQRTVFQSIDSKGRVDDTSYGYRLYDDYANHYTNIFESLEELTNMSAFDLIRHARQLAPEMRSMINSHAEAKKPALIDDFWMDLEEDDEEEDAGAERL